METFLHPFVYYGSKTAIENEIEWEAKKPFTHNSGTAELTVLITRLW